MIRTRPATPEYRPGHERIFRLTQADMVRELVDEGRAVGAVPWCPSAEISGRVTALLRLAGITRLEAMRETMERRRKA